MEEFQYNEHVYSHLTVTSSQVPFRPWFLRASAVSFGFCIYSSSLFPKACTFISYRMRPLSSPMVDLHELASKGKVEEVRKFLGRHAAKVNKTNRDGQTALHLAAKGYETVGHAVDGMRT